MVQKVHEWVRSDSINEYSPTSVFFRVVSLGQSPVWSLVTRKPPFFVRFSLFGNVWVPQISFFLFFLFFCVPSPCAQTPFSSISTLPGEVGLDSQGEERESESPLNRSLRLFLVHKQEPPPYPLLVHQLATESGLGPRTSARASDRPAAPHAE